MSEAGRSATLTETGYLGDRRAIARKAVDSIRFTIPGYLLGGLLVAIAGRDRLPDAFVVLFLGIAIFVAVGVAFEWAVTGHRPRFLRDSKARPYDARLGVTSLLLCFTLPAAGRAAGALEQIPTLAAWGVVGIICVVTYLIDFGPPLLRPNGFDEFRSKGPPPPIVILVVVALFALGLVAGMMASGLVDAAGARPVLRGADAEYGGYPSMTGAMPGAGWIALFLFAGGGVAAWWFGVSKGLYASGVTAFVVLLYWSEGVWRSIRYGLLDYVPPTLLVWQVVAGAALIAAMVVGYIFRRLPDDAPATDEGSASFPTPGAVALEEL